MTLSAKTMFSNTFGNRKLINTKIVKVGKLSRFVAFEISQENNQYSSYSKCFLTLVTSNSIVISQSDFIYRDKFDTSTEALAYVNQLKADKSVLDDLAIILAAQNSDEIFITGCHGYGNQ